ncbi:MAG TPA: hypothetical protein DCX17_03445 [Firmicutes bacterium]|nr:hypothetical protein [Bacillota bacterium]
MTWIDGVILGFTLALSAALIWYLVIHNRRGGSCASCSRQMSSKRSINGLISGYRKKYPKHP